MSHYGYFSMAQYNETVLPKINEYVKTNIVKKSRANYPSSKPCKGDIGYPKGIWKYYVYLKYDIDHGSSISFNHLLSLVLYTDFTDLSRDFSSTFRAVKSHETLDSIKQRNSNYYHWSKSLREMVQMFGSHDDFGTLAGPFFCGLSCSMCFPEFEIRLCSPTSTSYHLEVATKFTGGEGQGIIVQLNNTVKYHGCLRGFNCHWLSAFKEESEVLWFGGHYRIKIESVRILKTHNNYELFFVAFSKFNQFFNGTYDEFRGDQMSSVEKQIIMKLLNWKSNRLDGGFHQYIYDSFLLFTKSKTQIVLHLHQLYLAQSNDKHSIEKEILAKYITYDDEGFESNDDSDYVMIAAKIKELFDQNNIVGMLMHKITAERSSYESYDWREVNNNTANINLFRPQLFSIFDNIVQITIYATAQTSIGFGCNGHSQYYFSFFNLLRLISTTSSLKRIVIKADRQWNGSYGKDSWLCSLWSILGVEICKKYKEKQFDIKIKPKKQVTGRDMVFEDLILIERSVC
eukprot:386176_1